MKKEFELESAAGIFNGKVKIIGSKPNNRPYVSVNICGYDRFVKDKDLERFAVNILKALKSKRLK